MMYHTKCIIDCISSKIDDTVVTSKMGNCKTITDYTKSDTVTSQSSIFAVILLMAYAVQHCL